MKSKTLWAFVPTDNGFELHVTYSKGREYKYRYMEAAATRLIRSNAEVKAHWKANGYRGINYHGLDWDRLAKTDTTVTEIMVYKWAGVA